MRAPDAPIILTVGHALAAGAARLREAGSPSARLDAELLVVHALGRDRAWLHAHPEAPLGTDATAALDAWLDRRAAGEPIAYIRGYKEWLSLRIATDARALIPRPETELLAEAAMAEIADRLVQGAGSVVAQEVAAGGGAVTLALALRFRAALGLGRLWLTASDLSPDALELARENLVAYGVGDDVTLVMADMLADPDGSRAAPPQVVVANLPYLSTEEVDRGIGSLAFEPREALDGGPDGLELIGRLLEQLPVRAASGATALLEIGAGQADAVLAMAPPGASVVTERDLAGVERVVRIDLP